MLADHQRAAVARACELLRTRRGCLLADEVGLGKSFVAAAVAKECSADTELIVPAGLLDQWRDTLHRFEVRARLLTHDSLASDPFLADPARERLVIVDEAHAFRNPATQRYDALARRSVAARVLLVTATPVCNSLRDLHALLSLIAADDALADRGVASIDLAFAAGDTDALHRIVSELVIRRDAAVLPEELRFGALERRVVRHPIPDLPIDALQFPLTGSAPLLRRFLRRRLESSEAALLESLRRQRRFYERVCEGGRAITRRDYRRAFAHEEDGDVFQQLLFWEMFVPPAEAVDAGEVSEEMRRIDELRDAATAAPRTKQQLLMEALTGEPALVFTSSAATARDLHAALRPHVRCGVVTAREGRGGIEAFQAGMIDILIATDLAGEGLNLQRAGLVVHYDIPWNPVRLDQRNGRAHRMGQAREIVRAVYFLPAGDTTRIVATIAAKNRVRRAALRPAAVAAPPEPLHLRPRVARDAAILQLLRRGIDAAPSLRRRHKAGLERLIAEMSGEYLDDARLAHLMQIVAAEEG